MFLKAETEELMKVISAIGCFPERSIGSNEHLSITDTEQRFVIDLFSFWYRSWPGRRTFYLLIYHYFKLTIYARKLSV